MKVPVNISSSALFLFVLAVLAFAFAWNSAAASDEVIPDSAKAEVTMITIYDNYRHNPDLETGWGFSCLVEADGKKLLFDTGAEGSVLLGNMKALGIDPKQIDAVVLSHAHGDHAGGLFDLLEVNSNLIVFLLRSFPDEFKKKVESSKAKAVEVGDPVTISERLSTTGELGTSIREQSLILRTDKGLVVITGCAHPGIVSILKHISKITGENIYLVLGGFHLLNLSESALGELIKEFRELGVEKVAPSHCSGEETIKLFQEEYREDFIANGVGKEIES